MVKDRKGTKDFFLGIGERVFEISQIVFKLCSVEYANSWFMSVKLLKGTLNFIYLKYFPVYYQFCSVGCNTITQLLHSKFNALQHVALAITTYHFINDITQGVGSNEPRKY